MNPLIETWSINQRMNEFLLNALHEEHLNDVGLAKGRSVGEQFAHVHNVRLMWLKVAAPELLESQHKVEKDKPISKNLLIKELDKSSVATVQLLEMGLS